MAKHEKKGGLSARLAALGKYPVLILFFGFLAVMIAADWITPFRSASELENTTFIQRPQLTANDLTSGQAASRINRFFTNYSTFIKQQFTGRDTWIDIQSRCETLLFAKQEYGNVLLGDDGMEFARMYGLTEAEQESLPKNLAGVAALGDRYPGKVYTMIVPSASAIYPEKLPAGAPMLDENACLDEMLAQLDGHVTALDLRDTLTAHKDEYLYYRTDHHWTTTGGAWYGYLELCDALGLTPFDPEAHTAVQVPDFHGTNYAKCRQWNVEPDTITYYDLDNTLTVYRVTGADTAEVDTETGLYDESKFGVYDKYGAFLHGNNGYSRIAGDGEGSILIVKDSYANCLAPYLTANYANIDLIDLRNYNYGLDALIEKNDYDAILVLYSFDSFKSDANLFKVGVAG